MELVQGRSLREWVTREPCPDWRARTRAYLDAGRGLAAAHAEGLVHRDFKPSNAVIDDEGRVRVLDFGLARDAPEHDESREEPVNGVQEGAGLGDSLTLTGMVLGTPAYMPPEQMSGQEADARSDQFSYCVSLFESLYGQRPFDGNSLMALMVSMRSGMVCPAPKGSTVPSGLRTVLLRGLSVDPSLRWPSMDVLLDEIGAFIAPRTRRRGTMALAAGLMVLGGGVVAGRYLEVRDRCVGASAQFDGIWDDARRRDVEAAIIATGVPYATETWERLEPRLDAYVHTWVEGHTEACEATAVRHEQSDAAMDRRMGCLRKRRVSLRAAVNVLAEADAEVVEHAVTLAANLPDVERCGDVDWLEQQARRIPPPEDPDVARGVERLRDELVELDAMYVAGQYVAVLDRIGPVLQEATALGFAPLLAEVEQFHGESLWRGGRYALAEEALERAYTLALQNEHDEVALSAAQVLTFVVGSELARPLEGLLWAKTSLPLAEHTKRGNEIAVSLNSIALVLEDRGEYEESRDVQQRALRIFEDALGEHPKVATSEHNLGRVYIRLGEHESAKHHFERALRIHETALGPRHPHVARSLTGLANVHYLMGELTDSRLMFERALGIAREALGADHPKVAEIQEGLGNVLEQQGDNAGAEVHHRRAIRALERSLGPDHPIVAKSVRNLGNSIQNQGRYEEAELHYRRALRIDGRALDANHPDLFTDEFDLGRVLYFQGKYDDAQHHLERALQLGQSAETEDVRKLARVDSVLGTVLYAQQRYEDAARSYRRSLEMVEAASSPDPMLLGSSHSNLADALRMQGTYEDAARHYEEALETWEGVLGETHQDLAFPLVGLAMVERGMGDLDAAEAWAERAVAVRTEGAAPAELLADAQFVLARILWKNQPPQRRRARQLAEQARDGYAAHGAGQESDLAEVQAWLRTAVRL